VARLAQVSIRFKRFDIDEQRFQELGTQIDAVAARIAREVYGRGVEVDVVLEAGSLLVRITVIGSLLLGGYHAISEYKDFKEGITLLVKDANEWSSGIYKEVLKLTGEQKADTFVRRDMTPGRIARVIRQLEKVQVPNLVVQEEFQQIARDVQAIERDLEPEERRLIDRGFEFMGLPPLEKLCKPDLVHEERRSTLSKGEIEEIARAPGLSSQQKRKRLRYHNRFRVEEHAPRPPRPI